MPMDPLFKAATPAVPVRGVHLDLKGVPPTFERLVGLLDLFKAARYNAVLVEWEDTFPWEIDDRFRCETAYTPQQVRDFHHACEERGIEIIPLVQCLGHMETPLTVPDYHGMREVPWRADVLNPLADGARELVQTMVDEVAMLMPGLSHFHLGGDEAWSFGTHPDTKAFIEEHGKGALYLHHIEPILDSLNDRGIRPILWHDMMRDWDSDALERLAEKADLLVWGYNAHPDETTGHYNTTVAEHFKKHGITLWGGTAYKGGDGHNVDLPDLERRRTNGIGWAEVGKRLGMQGVIATAWSRYSTHTVQVEPIDACLDYLVAMGVWLHDAADVEGGLEACAEALEAIGERATFEACRDSMAKLSEARAAGWRQVQNLREQIVTMDDDPRRVGSALTLRWLGGLIAAVDKAEEAAADAQKAFEGLIPKIWIDRYLNERIQPLRDERDALTPRVRELEPKAYAEKDFIK